MRIHKSGREINSVKDWFQWAPPKKGDLHWKDGRSAKELARSWFRAQLPAPPDDLRSLLEKGFGTRIVFEEAEPECVVQLDEFHGEQRNCDLLVLCKTDSQQFAVSIEAKADEPFGDRVGHYYDLKLTAQSRIPQRIERLSMAFFGTTLNSTIREIRYQLLHASAAALIEAKKRHADSAVFLVHEFHSAKLDPEKVQQNSADWKAFVRAFPKLTAVPAERNQLLGPVFVPGNGWVPSPIPLYLGTVLTELMAEAQDYERV